MSEAEIDGARLEAFMGEMVGHMTGAITVACAVLGHQVGYYRAMANRGPMSADDVAGAADANPRVTREWLDQQAAVGIVSYDDANDTYELGPEAALALADERSPVYLAGGLEVFRALAIDIDPLTDAYNSDGAWVGGSITSACSEAPPSSSGRPMSIIWYRSGCPRSEPVSSRSPRVPR